MEILKHNVTNPYYIIQQDYGSSELKVTDMDGIDIYSPQTGEISGYYNFPTTTYPQMISDVELRGSGLKDGFSNKYQVK